MKDSNVISLSPGEQKENGTVFNILHEKKKKLCKDFVVPDDGTIYSSQHQVHYFQNMLTSTREQHFCSLHHYQGHEHFTNS